MKTHRQLAWPALALFLLAAPAPSGEPEWKVGLAQIKVTPALPVALSGYGGRVKPFEKVAADIYVKALVLEDRGGQRAVIVTSDLLGFPAAVAEPICERITKKTGLKREQILLNSSHTHAGPLLALEPPKDAPGPAEAQRTVEYTNELMDKVVQVVERAAAKLEPARLSWGGGVIHFAMNRREFTPERIILGVNPRGLTDRSVPVLRIDGADGKPRAVLFGAATHGTTLGGDNYQLCGDYAGFAQAEIEERLPGVAALFMLGCAGDSNPYPRGTMELAQKHGKTLADEVCRVLETKLRPIKGPLKVTFERAEVPLQPSLPRDFLEKLAATKGHAKAFAAKAMLAILDKGEKPPAFYPCPLAVWQLGDLTLVGLSGEVVVEYVPLIEKAIGPNNVWIAAYCNEVFGYLPSARVLSEGGYETRGMYSGGAGFFDMRAEQVVVDRVREMARKVGRKVGE